MHRLRTVFYLDVSAVAGHHAMPAALLFYFFLPRSSLVRLSDHPDMIIVVYRGHKTTTQQQQQIF